MLNVKNVVLLSGTLAGFLIVMWLIFGESKGDKKDKNIEYNLIRSSKLDPSIIPEMVDQTPSIEAVFSRKETSINVEKKSSVEPKGRNWKTNPSAPEKASRKWLEEYFGTSFPATYPEWLVNPETGRKLELDCYNKDLAIAVECNGVHHYVWPNWTGMSYEKFIKVVRKDDYKRALCERMGILLITVPYTVKTKKIGEFIEQKLPQYIEA